MAAQEGGVGLAYMGAMVLGRARSFLCPAGLAKVFIVGLVIRLAIAPWTCCPFDTYPFYSASVDMLAGMGMYGHAVFSYPPGFGFVMYPFMFFLSLFTDPSLFGSFHPEMIEVGMLIPTVYPFVTSPAFNLALKLPLIIGDVLTASMLFLLMSEWKGERLGRTAYMLWFLNPLVIWISSVVGQFDVLAVLCTLVAAYFFIHERYALAGLSVGAGMLLKVYPAYLGLFFLIYLLLVGGVAWKDRLTSVARLIGGAAASALPALPLLLTTPEMLDIVLRRAGNDSFGGINPWFIAPYLGIMTPSAEASTGAPDFLQTPMFITLVGLILVVIVAIALARSSRPLRESIFAGSLVVLIIALLFRSVTNPQHLLWVLPFMLIFSFIDSRMRIPMFMLTASGLLASLTFRSFAVFFYPLAAYTPLISVGQLNSIVFTYFSGGPVLQAILFSLSCLLGVMAMLWAVATATSTPSGWIRERLWGARE